MILESLYERSQTLDLPPPRYQKAGIHWVIRLDQQGELVGAPVPRILENGRGKTHPIPNPGKRTTGISPAPFADTATYALGIPKRNEEESVKDTKRRQDKFNAFQQITAVCAEEVDHYSVKAVKRFIENGPFAEDPRFAEIDGGQYVMFEVEDVNPVDLPEVRNWWANAGADTRRGTCMITGKQGPLVRRHPLPLKGVPGGQSSGVQLMCANEDPFYSYGLDESYIAPMSLPVSEAVHHTINDLIQDERHRYRFSDKLIFLFWTRSGQEVPVSYLLSEPTEDMVKDLFRRTWRGQGPGASFDTDAFYCLVLSGSGGRAVVRDWIETTIPTVQTNLQNYFKRQRIAGGRRPYLPLFQLAKATVWDAKDIAPQTPVHLARQALFGVPLPVNLLTTTLRRCYIGWKTKSGRGHVTHAQAALIKLWLSVHNDHEDNPYIPTGEEKMVRMEHENDRREYLVGRLVRVLERIQENAVGTSSIGRTLGATANAPVSTLARHIIRARQAHLPKLYRDKRGLAIHLDREMTHLLARIDKQEGIPARLDTVEQAFFILGYHHQREEDFTKREDDDKKEEEA